MLFAQHTLLLVTTVAQSLCHHEAMEMDNGMQQARECLVLNTSLYCCSMFGIRCIIQTSHKPNPTLTLNVIRVLSYIVYQALVRIINLTPCSATQPLFYAILSSAYTPGHPHQHNTLLSSTSEVPRSSVAVFVSLDPSSTFPPVAIARQYRAPTTQ